MLCVTCGCDSMPQSDEVTYENLNNNKPYIIVHHYHGCDNTAKSNHEQRNTIRPASDKT